MRVFAGPNGSGKSTIKSLISPSLLGVYINPDEIEGEIRASGCLCLQNYLVETNHEDVLSFVIGSTLGTRAFVDKPSECLSFSQGLLSVRRDALNSHVCSIIADFLRQKLIQQRISFTFETVMSSPDKVLLLEAAQRLGYRTYLYYVATEDPVINISRVRTRVRLGGHDVPEDKIVSRYGRSLRLLKEAIRHSNRAYLFDNSGHEHVWLAEITEGETLELKTDHVPKWFIDAVLNKGVR